MITLELLFIMVLAEGIILLVVYSRTNKVSNGLEEFLSGQHGVRQPPLDRDFDSLQTAPSEPQPPSASVPIPIGQPLPVPQSAGASDPVRLVAIGQPMPRHPISPVQAPPQPASWVPVSPMHAQQAPAQFQPVNVRAMAPMHPQQAPTGYTQNVAPAVAAWQTGSPAPGFAASNAAQGSFQQHMPAPPASYAVRQAALPQTPTDAKSMENWFGRNVIGIIAAVLVFLGLIFLGFLVVPSLTDAVKIALMFLLSTVLTVAGAALTLKKKNNFTTALLGCGCGSFFISILITQLYFHVLGEIPALVALLVWMAASLALVKLSDSLLMSILVHAGMVISLCFAFSGALNPDAILVLLVYQVLSIALITAGNIVCYRKTYRFGLFASLGLTLLVSIAMYAYYAGASTQTGFAGWMVALVAFVVQGVGAAFLSYLLFVSATRMEDSSLRHVLQLFNKLLLIAVLFVCSYLFPLQLCSALIPGSGTAGLGIAYSAFAVATGAAVAVGVVHAALTMLLHAKANSDAAMEAISLISLSTYLSVLLLVGYILCAFFYPAHFHMPGLVLVAFGYVVFGRLTGTEKYSVLALVTLGIDFFVMVGFGGYHALVKVGTVAAGFAYMIAAAGILFYLWTRLDEDRKAETSLALKIVLLALFEVSVVSVFSAAAIDPVFTCMVLVAAFIFMIFAKVDERKRVPKGFWIFLRFHELVLILISAGVIALYPGAFGLMSYVQAVPGTSGIFYALLACLSLALLVCSLLRVKSYGDQRLMWIGCLQGIAFTVLVLATISGLTAWFDEPYVFSIVCMLAALACIMVGFAASIKPLRLYGLILVLVCVLKLVTYDLGNVESIMRVIAFIVGGLICFGISALYSYAVKRFDEKAMA